MAQELRRTRPRSSDGKRVLLRHPTSGKLIIGCRAPCTSCAGVQANAVVTDGTCSGTFAGCAAGAVPGGGFICRWIWGNSAPACNRADDHVFVGLNLDFTWRIEVAGPCSLGGYLLDPASSTALFCNAAGNLEGGAVLVNPLNPADTCVVTLGP